jgi:hypothetical protein
MRLMTVSLRSRIHAYNLFICLFCFLGLRVEWCKCYARAERWKEEVELVLEEMRRVLRFFNWRSSWWHRQSKLRQDVSDALAEGLTAYAHKQVQILQDMGGAFAAQWSPLLAGYGLTHEWPSHFLANGTETSSEPFLVPEEEIGDEDELVFDDDLFD